ncbi:hypothetical protein OSJ77_06070 [Phyllobacterium sp. 0TCS1.6C]|uniref:lactonase family protein n=1 Tax=unclassified Phyllobacterium TaxID=2638441 RepID=UPI0022652A12|nr:MULTISPECIES: hypothetical protein [unclassified Phyllobacterium]MCX8279745.1 hypothetical protein [Phyllobacterium sp. 0TCS1.6C]MCX8295651.1 hypothetical protein [Phyllobacterium sp. 0TCS1.6A]
MKRLSTLLSVAACLAGSAHAQETSVALPPVPAGTIAAISDGDFVAQSYANGVLAPREAEYRDVLSILSVADGKLQRAELPVSNSVTAAPEVLALTPDGRTAFVTERLAERTEDTRLVKDLRPGNRVFAIDLSDKTAPRQADTQKIADFPEALAIDPSGRRIAVVSNTREASLVQLISYSGGRFGAVETFDLAELGIKGTAGTPRGGVTATNVQWHPSGRFLAININTQNRIAFLAVDEADGRHVLKPWGNIVDVGADPFVGRFTPDGRFYITSDWGRDFSATDLDGRIPDRRSGMTVIRFAETAAAGEARHEKVENAESDIAAEGIAISPDGRLVATVNMRTTAFPPSSSRFTREATVSLLSLDPDTGGLAKIGDYPFEGVLPEGATFDLTGDKLLVTVFQDHEGQKEGIGAGIEVFEVVKGETPSLLRRGRIPMPHGLHHVAIAQ